MSKRLELQTILETLGASKVYFQPPSTLKMNYPCIVYKRSRLDSKRANDKIYNSTVGYMVTVIDPNPDSLIPTRVLNLPLCCQFDRHYTADNLNHDVFNLYY
jgi:hypothetical protein